MFDFCDEILTVEQVAEMLYIGKNTAYELLRNGEIRAFRIDRNWRVPKDEVIEFTMKRMERGIISR